MTYFSRIRLSAEATVAICGVVLALVFAYSLAKSLDGTGWLRVAEVVGVSHKGDHVYEIAFVKNRAACVPHYLIRYDGVTWHRVDFGDVPWSRPEGSSVISIDLGGVVEDLLVRHDCYKGLLWKTDTPFWPLTDKDQTDD